MLLIFLESSESQIDEWNMAKKWNVNSGALFAGFRGMLADTLLLNQQTGNAYVE